MKNILLALLTGLLLYVGWPTSPLTYLLFVAFIPLLWVEKSIRVSDLNKKGARVLFIAWAAFALFNVTGTWWVKNAHWSGTVATTIVNGFLMALVFWIYHKVAKILGEKRALFVLPFIWICVEVLHQDWQLSFPWLDLGQGLATHIEWVQWYEYTGHLGGTLWIWVINLALFKALEMFVSDAPKKHFLRYLFSRLFFWFVMPVALSTYTYMNYKEKGEPVNIVVVQPNIESFTEKFTLSEEEQLQKFSRLAKPFLHDSIDFLVGPETMVKDAFDENKIRYSNGIAYLQKLKSGYPNLSIVAGAVTYKTFNEPTLISTKYRNVDLWYELYNTSFIINNSDSIQLYHKSKLVVAAEYMPFMSVLKPLLGDVVIDLGGMVGSHGTQPNREVFVGNDGTTKVGTSICWENEFGEFMTGYAREGANLIFNITNDGWWGDTDGHRQHMHYARLRSVENRRATARSANTGISCFINQRGEVLQSLGWAKEGALTGTLYANNQLTFYTKWGDIIGRVSVLILILTVVYTFTQGVLKRKNREEEEKA